MERNPLNYAHALAAARLAPSLMLAASAAFARGLHLPGPRPGPQLPSRLAAGGGDGEPDGTLLQGTIGVPPGLRPFGRAWRASSPSDMSGLLSHTHIFYTTFTIFDNGRFTES